MAYRSKSDGKIHIHKLKDGKLKTIIGILRVEENFGNFIFIPDSKYIAASYGARRKSGLLVSAPSYYLTSHGRIRLWRVEDGKMIKTFRGHRKYTSNLRAVSGRNLLVSYGGDNTIRFLRLPRKD